jgi:YD repeat-containing protein
LTLFFRVYKDNAMDPSVFGTGSLVLAKASSAYRRIQGTLPLPHGCAEGCPIPNLASCIVDGSSVRIDPYTFDLTLNWSPPSGSPADFPLVYYYQLSATNSTEVGYRWSGTYHRYAEPQEGINPEPVNVWTPTFVYSYGNTGSAYTTQTGQNTLVGSGTSGWTETQPNGTAFTYLTTGVLSTIRNRAGVRWTLTWDSGFNLVQNIQGPFGRRTTFTYNASSNLTRIQDPGGRITSVTVDSNGNLTRIISPALCVTSLVYDSSHNLLALVSPLGDRTSFIQSAPLAIQQPMGQRTTYLTVRMGKTFIGNAIVNPLGVRTTFPINAMAMVPLSSSVDPFGNTTNYKLGGSYSQLLMSVKDARGVRTSFTYQVTNNGAYFLSGVQKTGFNSGTGIGQYSYFYNSNNQVKAVVDELGNRSTLVWDSLGNRIAVVDPYNQRTSYIYDSMGRLTAVRNALGQRATQLYDSQGRRSVDINPLGQRTSYAYDINSQLLRVQDPLGHITTTLHDNMNRLTVSIDAVGNRTSYSYDANGRLVHTKNPIGAIATQIYDLNSRLIATIDPLGLRTSFGYDLCSNLIRTINPLGQINTGLFDIANRLVAQVDPLGNRTSFGYDVA